MSLNMTEVASRRRQVGGAFVILLWINAGLLAGLNAALNGPLPSLFILAGGAILAVLPSLYWRWRQGGDGLPVVSSMALAAQIALLTMTVLPLSRGDLELYQNMHGWFFAGLCICALWLDRRAVLSFFGLATLYQLAAYWLLPDFWFVDEGAIASQSLRLGMFVAGAAALFVLISRWSDIGRTAAISGAASSD